MIKNLLQCRIYCVEKLIHQLSRHSKILELQGTLDLRYSVFNFSERFQTQFFTYTLVTCSPVANVSYTIPMLAANIADLTGLSFLLKFTAGSSKNIQDSSC